MRNFYLLYEGNKKLAPLVREISWSKNIIIMEKCKKSSQREFYIKMTKNYKNIYLHRRKSLRGWENEEILSQKSRKKVAEMSQT